MPPATERSIFNTIARQRMFAVSGVVVSLGNLSLLAGLIWIYSYQDKHDFSHSALYVGISLGVMLQVVWTAMFASVLGSQIREKFNAQESMRLSLARQNLAMEAGRCAAWEWDVRNRRLAYTDGFSRMLGYERTELPMTPQLWSELMHPDDLLNFIDELNAHLEGQSSDFSRQYRMRKRDGSYLWVHTTGTVVERSDAGSVLIISGIQKDITELKLAEQQLQAQAKILESQASELKSKTITLEQKTKDLELARHESDKLAEKAEAANKAKSAFLANISHEIRTPMNAIVGFTELLDDATVTPAKRSEMVDSIRRNAAHLLGLINDVLDLSKIEANAMQVESIESDIVGIFRDVRDMMEPSARGKGLALTVSSQGIIPRYIQTDPLRAKQILVNLISNAVRHTSVGSVSILVRTKGNHLLIEVVDTGEGISEEVLSKLFKPFTQADASSTRKHGGTGLGLSISRQLARMMGGDVTVNSQLGKGSTFSLWIPLTEHSLKTESCNSIENLADEIGTDSPAVCAPLHLSQPALASSEIAGESSQQSIGHDEAKTVRVLLAEDGVDNRKLIIFHLKKLNAHVEVAENGQVAVDMVLQAHAANRPYDLVLMDMQMPVMDGYTAACELRHLGFTLPVIALTAHAMSGDREKCLAAGCSDYLTKPISRNLLAQTITKWISASVITPTKKQGTIMITSNNDKSQDPNVAAAITVGVSAGPLPPLRSEFADDPDMAEILGPFIESLDQTSIQIRSAYEGQDSTALGRLAHQIKGAAGGYGFPTLTEAAASLEAKLKSGAPLNDVVQEVDLLLSRLSAVEKPGRLAA